MSLPPAIFDCQIFCFDIAGFAQPLAKSSKISRRDGVGPSKEERADDVLPLLLRPCSQWPSGGERNDVTASHHRTMSTRRSPCHSSAAPACHRPAKNAC